MKSMAKNILLITIITIFLTLLTGEVITYEFDYDFGGGYGVNSLAIVNGLVEVNSGTERFLEDLTGAEVGTSWGGYLNEGGSLDVYNLNSAGASTRIDSIYYTNSNNQIYSGPANQSPQFLWQTSDVIKSITNDGENVVGLASIKYRCS